MFFEDLSGGMTRSRSFLITKEKIRAFLAVTEDNNPIHFDDEFAQKTPFRGVIAPGKLGEGLASAIVANELPGHGAVLLCSSTKYISPQRPNDLLNISVSVTSVDAKSSFGGYGTIELEFTGTITNKPSFTGKATLLVPKRQGV